jgi:hypothetical protein
MQSRSALSGPRLVFLPIDFVVPLVENGLIHIEVLRLYQLWAIQH